MTWSQLCSKILNLLITFFYLFHPHFSNPSQLSLTLENKKGSYSHAITSENAHLHSETAATLLVFTATWTGTVCNVMPRSAEMQIPAMPECTSQGWCSPWDTKAVHGEDVEKQLNSLAWDTVCAQSSLPATTLLGKQGAWLPPHWHGQVWDISASQEDGTTRELQSFQERTTTSPLPSRWW